MMMSPAACRLVRGRLKLAGRSASMLSTCSILTAVR
jgi:hypothetical protein